jgi:futalosine hydrolase
VTRLLIVTAVAAERDAIAAALASASESPTPAETVTLLVGGVGPVAAAATTSAELAVRPADLAICAGIGGGFAPLEPGELAVASTIVFADLGAETADGFVPVSELGLAGERHDTDRYDTERYDVDPQLAIELADVTGGRLGTVLTVATVTGTAATADGLLARYPDAVAEAMEGAGVAAAAARHGTRFAELRAVSNLVGPRDRDAWRIPDALASLGGAVSAIVRHAGGWTS